MNKKGSILWNNVADIVLITIILIILVLFVYFGRDKIKDYADIILELLGI